VDAPALGFLAMVYDRFPGDFARSKVPTVRLRARCCQGEQRLDEAFLLVAQGEQLPAG